MSLLPNRPTSAGRIRLHAGHEALICVALLGLVVSGALWLVYHYLVPRGEVMATNPVEAWSLRVHGGLAMAALMLLGSLALQHIAAAWQRRLNRGSGGLMLGAMLFLVVTGYLLYYASNEGLRDATSWLHWSVGLALPVLLGIHMQRGGRWRRSLAGSLRDHHRPRERQSR